MLYVTQGHLLKVNAFYTCANRGKHFVGDGVEYVWENRYGQVIAKDFYLVALFAWNVGDINHANIHANVANVGCFVSINQTVASTIA